MGESGDDHAPAAPVSVLIDPPLWPAHGRRWSHLVSDASLAELHAFARRIGVPERGFEGDHYDVPEERYADAVHSGAIPVSSRELLRRLQGSGLRRPKRRGERVLASAHLPDGTRVDTLESTRVPVGRVEAVILVVRRKTDLLVLAQDEAFSLPRAPVPEPAGDQDPDQPQDGATRASSSLLTELLGPVGPVGPPVQLGYLRTLAPSAAGPDPQASRFAVVWRWLLDGVPAAVEPAMPALWTPLDDAMGLLPADLAPLVRAGSGHGH